MKSTNLSHLPLADRHQLIIDFRAKRKCEWCGAPQYAVGQRIDGEFHPVSGSPYLDEMKYSADYHDALDLCVQLNWWDENARYPYIVIVLSVTRLDNDNPEDDDLENFAALCQRCRIGTTKPTFLGDYISDNDRLSRSR